MKDQGKFKVGHFTKTTTDIPVSIKNWSRATFLDDKVDPTGSSFLIDAILDLNVQKLITPI